jgi:hypothetical protein
LSLLRDSLNSLQRPAIQLGMSSCLVSPLPIDVVAIKSVLIAPLPAGNGFMVVDDPAKYNLKPGVPTKDGRETHAIAMYHQLHCLVGSTSIARRTI